MLTKVKRIRRKKYATGDEARKFTNIPTGSQPQQGGLGTRNQNIDKYVTDQIKSPELASSAQQSYTQQAVQSNELLSGNVQAAPTDVGTTTITGINSLRKAAKAIPFCPSFKFLAARVL